MAKSIVFIDTEVGVDDHKIHDIGAVRQDRAYFHSASVRNFVEFIAGAEYICGHNILHHDLKYIHDSLGYELRVTVIDTLYLSPLLFPKRPYHALLKDDKLQTEQLNDPVNDCQKAASLFYDEVNAFFDLPPKVKQIFCCLLYDHPEFSGFFQYVNFRPYKAKIYELIHMEYEGRICTNADLLPLIRHYPVELAYALALIGANDEHSITPPWLLKNYPKIENVIKYLRGTPCANGCTYCHNALDIHRELKRIFGYDSFRTYNGEPLQEKAAQAAVDGKSVLAVFPTGGGKSITFQLPALMAGKAVHGLTVVISPLQSLMKDQVDNLNAIGINEAVTVNGLLDPIERANALERVANGSATLLYISPEQLRSRTIEKLLVSRNVARFVIDEAHCFSAWGQDFRVDYLYIGDFIRELQKQKTDKRPIPVSCFTATAKQKVISDICGYFKRKLDLDLEIFASSATRENLHYTVLYKETDDEKYAALRDLIAQKNCPTIVYVSRTKRTHELAEKLTNDGFPAKANQLDIAEQEGKPVQFSLIELYHAYIASPNLTTNKDTTSLTDIEDALLYLSKIGALKLEGGFLVLYNGMEIKRLITDNRIKYKVDDYRFLDEFYKQKIRQIHIVGEYANLMVRDYQAALQFVQDYFQMDFRKFVTKYFKGERIQDIDRNITPQKYHQLFGELSDKQSQIINDADSKYIVVAAGPGSGKTRVLVHKLAALLLLEDVKHEQLLMLTFSRAAATEFKKRLIELIGNAANFVEIKTFHSYCFDLLGKIGSLEGVDDVVKNAAEMIKNGEVEQGKIVKSVLVIDEAQDMDANEFDLISAMMQANDDMRVIAVGDDDQNIYAFRGSDSKYLRTLIENRGATKYEMTENYRSGATIVALANSFAKTIQDRMKLAPVEAVREDCGIVRITHHHEKHMETAVVNEVISTQGNSQCCILTNTNDEALRLLGLLTKSGIRAKLIQSLDGFRLYNLVEVRYFLKKIDAGLKSPVISNDLWNRAKEHLFDAYAGSPCLEICGNLIRDFEETNPTKYRTDLEEFIRESNYEDFYPDDHEIVFISTIHKAKGREFDTVYMMLDGNTAATDEEKRKLYVGMTRAKNALYIHCNTELFSAIAIPEIEYIEDQNCYEEPTELTLQLTHRDVVLDFFKGKKELLLKLRSGMALSLIDCYLLAKLNGKTVRIAKLSKACKDRIESLLSKGYCPVSAEIRFIVAWKKEGDADETPVVLPDIHFQKELSIK